MLPFHRLGRHQFDPRGSTLLTRGIAAKRSAAPTRALFASGGTPRKAR